MIKVILTRGLPASGKTYWAKEQLIAQPGAWKRVNKDDLRAMLDGGKWSRDNEKFVLAVRDLAILEAVGAGKHVIVDDTNFGDKHLPRIEQLVKGKAVVEVRDFTHVPLETCLERNRKRLNAVPDDVILRMHREFIAPKVAPLKFDPLLPNRVICDLDGTLAILNGRNPYDASTCAADGINWAVLDVAKKHQVIFVSGRPEQYRDQTLEFLTRCGFVFLDLFMRADGDSRPDTIIKREIYDREIAGKYNISFVLDDRPSVIRMWRSLGLFVFDCGDGIEF